MPWYEQFFSGLAQQAWKEAQSEEETELEADFLADLLELQPGHRVLDVFCGYGRHARELARRDCRVTGVDIAPDYTRELTGLATSERLPIEVLTGDFLRVPIPSGFEAAYCLGNSFSFFPHDQMLAFLGKIAGALQPGGRFVADTRMVAESVLPDFQERAWLEAGAITVLIENAYDPVHSRIDSHLQYLHRSPDRSVLTTEHRTARHYLFTVAELHRLFRQAGLTITEQFGDLEGSPYALGDERLLLLARRT